jgi:hypothetical protein
MKVVLKRTAIRHGREFLRHVVPTVVRPARILWNEVIGFLFLSFAAIFGFKTFRYAMDFASASGAGADTTGEVIRLAMAGFCTLVMAWYGFSSFRRARKISRS